MQAPTPKEEAAAPEVEDGRPATVPGAVWPVVEELDFLGSIEERPKECAVVLARMAIVTWLAASLTTVSSATAQAVGSPRRCSSERLRGTVSSGQEFWKEVMPGLLFRLDPEAGAPNPTGWTIRVTPVDSPETDYSMVATPPYRFANPRYVDTGYGMTAQTALSMTPRDFAFVASSRDYNVARGALDVLLWPGNHSEAEVEEARSVMAELPVYPATFSILEGSVRPGDSANPNGLIEWMTFEVELCLPR